MSAQVASINIDTSGKCAVMCSPNDVIDVHYYKRPRGSKLKTQVVWHDCELQKESLQFLGEKLIPMIQVEGKSPPTIHLYNTHKIGNMHFTANSQHYTQRGCTEGWHDWALADLTGDAFPDEVQKCRTAIHMMTFVEITGQTKRLDIDCIQCKGAGMYVLCHVLYKGGLSERAHAQSRLVNVGTKYCSRFINRG
jgi:hydrogenase maturation factor